MELIRPVAKLAYDIYHEIVPFDPDRHLSAGEEQCTYCPVRGRCVARAKRIMSMFEPLVKRHELDDKSLGACTRSSTRSRPRSPTSGRRRCGARSRGP